MSFLKFPGRFISITLPLIVLVVSCRPQKRILKSPPHYSFSEVFTEKLEAKLKEISGLAWDSKKNEFLAHNDETGKLFYLDRDSKAIKEEYVFGGKGDYEDIALMNGIPYILRSDGLITRVIKDSAGKDHGDEVGKLVLDGTNDFETLYYDNTRNGLITICKNCAMDNKKTVSAFIFYPDSIGFINKPIFTIDAAKIEELSPQKTSKFQPSAAAIHPVLQKLFIISSASNQLVIADLDGNVESVYTLSKKLFPQPEGLAFTKNGDMYISNEGGTTGRGLILKFLYKL